MYYFITFLLALKDRYGIFNQFQLYLNRRRVIYLKLNHSKNDVIDRRCREDNKYFDTF